LPCFPIEKGRGDEAYDCELKSRREKKGGKRRGEEISNRATGPTYLRTRNGKLTAGVVKKRKRKKKKTDPVTSHLIISCTGRRR